MGQRVRLQLQLGEAEAGEYAVTVLAVGLANGWQFAAAPLRAACEAGLFDQVTSFVDHGDIWSMGRSVKDIAGVVHAGRFDESKQAVVARFRPFGPAGALARDLVNECLGARAAGLACPPVGLSVDIGFEASGREVKRITRVWSVDIVHQPASVGAGFDVRLQAEPGGDVGGHDVGDEVMTVEDAGARAQALLVEQCRATLGAVLAASGLPEILAQDIRERFDGTVFEPEALKSAIERAREVAAALAPPVRGLGAEVRVGLDGFDGFRVAFDRLMGLDVAEVHSDIPRLSGIREAYHILTGDYDMYGVFNPTRARFANASTSTMAALVANVMNKRIPARAAELGRAGYDWWRRVVHEEDFTTLQEVNWMTVGGFGDLPTVAEGAAYTELTWDDNGEPATWTKKGGYIGLTLEMIDRDETRRVRQIPDLLATAAVRTLSSTVAAIFTQNSGTGPTLADGDVLFYAPRGNLTTTALSASQWDVIVQSMFKVTELNSGKRLGIRPRYVLVPIELEKTALQIFVSNTEPSSNLFYDNVRRSAAENVIAVPEWTDANDWAAVADPLIAPGIGVGYRFGRLPEVFVADQPEVGSMFTNDELRAKVRWFFTVGVIDWRPLHKANVA